MSLSGAMRCPRCCFLDLAVSETGDMLPLPPCSVPIPIQLAGFVGVRRDPLESPISHRVLADFEGTKRSLVLYIPKAEIFADKRRACDYLKGLRCYAADRKTSFVNAAEAIGALLSKASSPLCAETLPRICSVIQAVESRKFEIFQI